eukprot:TRINITY_DN91456_c0_g1_i1.p1 TRINITY_DN91456_c0_g1~~TRINITY_DN91456_c0_g1_i1.p1  ORF type:complete len:449 (-),score=123.43 TRINITY_DN91456_c0_g1_i1:95-1441(-)
MDELYRVGQKVAQDNAGFPGMDPGLLASALGGDANPDQLADLLAGGNMEEYLKSYEQMLQQGTAPDLGLGQQLDQVDHEGGVTTRPEPGFVIKTKDSNAGTKIFINVVASEHVEAPHMKSYTELDGEEGCRVPLSIGTPVEDFDKKGEPCVTYDVVANPEVVKNSSDEPAFREQVVQLCIAAISQKYKLELDQRFKLPKIKYKGTTVQLQRIRKKKESQIQEMRNAESSAPLPGSSASRRASGDSTAPGGNRGDGPQAPDFAVFYALPNVPPLKDAFSRDWGAPPEDVEEAVKESHLSGLDLPCYRVNAFQEKIRGTMRNKADREKEPQGEAEAAASASKATREMLAGRTCFVQVHLPDLDAHVPSLKQFGLEVSDECMRLNFPMLPRSKTSAYSHLTIWWPQLFCSAQAAADWDPKADMLTVCLPAESEVATQGEDTFDQDLLDAVF